MMRRQRQMVSVPLMLRAEAEQTALGLKPWNALELEHRLGSFVPAPRSGAEWLAVCAFHGTRRPRRTDSGDRRAAVIRQAVVCGVASLLRSGCLDPHLLQKYCLHVA
jgi:hypothetical protein